MQKLFSLLLIGCIISSTASAQYYRYRGRMYMGNTQPTQRGNRYENPRRQRNQDNFKPSFNLLLGYGFPNLDKNEMLEFYNYYPGKVSQTGPFMGIAEYQFNRTSAFGIMATYGKLSRPYYYQNDVAPNFTGKLENTSLMLSFTRYMPASRTVTPYLRTAIGLNFPHSSYLNDATGAPIVRDADDNSLAYQVGLGVKLNFTQRAGLFVEAGYGKYIVAGGLALKF